PETNVVETWLSKIVQRVGLITKANVQPLMDKVHEMVKQENGNLRRCLLNLEFILLNGSNTPDPFRSWRSDLWCQVLAGNFDLPDFQVKGYQILVKGIQKGVGLESYLESWMKFIL